MEQMFWTTKPQGLAGTGTRSRIRPDAIGQAHLAAGSDFGAYGTDVSNATAMRPEGLGGSTG